MTVKNRIFLFVFVLLEFAGLLFLPGYAAVRFSNTSGDVSDEEILLAGAAREKDRLNLVSAFALTIGEKTVGSVALYDDPTTERPADYLEFYDRAGDLLAVGWFDRFGIERTAVDRALLEDADKPVGVFVVLLDGDSI